MKKNKSKLISAGEAPPSQFPTADDLSHWKNFKHQAKNSIEQCNRYHFQEGNLWLLVFSLFFSEYSIPKSHDLSSIFPRKCHFGVYMPHLVVSIEEVLYHLYIKKDLD
jgi:hypothetical protein